MATNPWSPTQSTAARKPVGSASARGAIVLAVVVFAASWILGIEERRPDPARAHSIISFGCRVDPGSIVVNVRLVGCTLSILRHEF